ncbi:MAG: hypothetical protein Q4D60_00440 [Eubacteriales bacterium]|nr:hypothetical protein [Eubacteriales bacterium]
MNDCRPSAKRWFCRESSACVCCSFDHTMEQDDSRQVIGQKEQTGSSRYFLAPLKNGDW